MLTVPVERVDIRPFGDVGAFYSVAFKRGKHSLDRFLCEDNTISASGMLTEFRNEVKKCVKILKGVYVYSARFPNACNVAYVCKTCVH